MYVCVYLELWPTYMYMYMHVQLHECWMRQTMVTKPSQYNVHVPSHLDMVSSLWHNVNVHVHVHVHCWGERELVPHRRVALDVVVNTSTIYFGMQLIVALCCKPHTYMYVAMYNTAHTVFSRVSTHGHLQLTGQKTGVSAYTDKPFV